MDTARAGPRRLPVGSGRHAIAALARDAALLGVPVLAAGALVTVGPRAWLLASLAVAGLAIALVPARVGERSALGELLFLSVALAVVFAGLNAIRPAGSLTASDLAFLVALGLAALALVIDPSTSRKLMPPWWLVGATVGLLIAGMLVGSSPRTSFPS